MPRPKGGLGRGLGSLIPQSMDQQESAGQETPAPRRDDLEGQVGDTPQVAGLIEVSVDAISPNPRQPRQSISAGELDELAASIREHGVLQPLVVTGAVEGKYNLIAGERRWRASMLAGLPTVPAIVKETTPRNMLELALVENLQRADLNPLEEAAAYRSLLDEFGLKQEEVAGRVGKSRQAVANSMRLLRLPPPIQEALSLGLITEGHARALLQVPGEAEQLRLMERTVADGLSVRQVEALARRLAEAAGDVEIAQSLGKAGEDVPADEGNTPLYDEVRDLEDRLRNALGTKVQLSRSSRGGKLVIYFYSTEELSRIYGTIVREE